MRCSPILLVCPLLQGCLAFGYPSVTQTPPIVVTAPEVKIFRVTSDFEFFGHFIAGAITFHNSIEEISSIDGVVPSQRDTYFDYHTFVLGFGGSHSKSVGVVLYRRGYETVIVEPHSCLAFWRQKTITPTWKKAETLEAREEAIDSLDLHRSGPSSAISAFVACEYTALAEMASEDKSRKRLLEKAQKQSRTENSNSTATNR